MALRVIELDIDEALSGDTRVEEIALVLQPAIETEFMWFSKQEFEESISDYPQYIIDNAKRAKKWVDENGYGDCMTPVGKNRLNQLANGEPISVETIKRMYSYLARHKKDLETSKSYDDGCGLLAYDSWGGVEALDWSERFLQRVEEEMGYDVGALTPWSQTTGTTQNFVKPRAGEDKSAFISRCIAYVRNEGKSEREAAGKCYGMWESGFAEVGPRGGIVESDKAPKSDTPNRNPQGEGSAKGDASGKRGAKVTEEQEKTLQKKVDDFNERESNTKNGRATLGALKSVFQRGLGAYNTSHSPEVRSSEQWAYARVNAFLYLLKNGRPENPKYTTDYDLLPKDHPKAKDSMSLSEYDLDVFGYMTKYFEICPGAQATFKDLVSIKPTEDSIGMIRSAAVVADSVFKIEATVLEKQTATQEQLDEAVVLVEDFKDIIGELEKIYNKKYDVSYMDNHIKLIASYVGKEDMAEIEGCGCDCGCSDGTIDTDGLYFGTTMINGMPVFESADEAATYAQVIGCNGSHEHMVDGKVVYMPCDIHNPEIVQETSPEVLELIEDKGVELEDLLKAGWVIDEVNEVDAEKIRKEMAQKFNQIKPEKFYQIITTPGEPSVQDLGNKRFRYVYMVGFGSELIETSRQFCRRMLGGRQFVFRYEDIMALSAAIGSEAGNMKIIPRPKGTSVDLFSYKGGANCRHYWLQLVFSPGIAGITSEQTPQNKITNNARKMKEEADYQIPAPNMAGTVNPPVDYGSRSPQSVGMSKEEFRRSESRVIIVDVDDTLVRGNTPIKKTVDYVNRKWEDHRIVVVSARQKSRTGETERELDRLGIKWDDIYLSDFPQGPNAGNSFKEYKAKWLMDKGYRISEAIDNSGEARRLYSNLGINAKSPTSLKALPAGFLQGLAIFKDKEDAKEWSFGCGCGGSYEPVDYLGEVMFQACSLKKQKMSTQFSLDDEKRMIYSPAMKPGILIPRLDEVTREKYFVTFKPETIERMAQRFLIEGRTNKTNYEHSEVKFEDVYLVESWIVNGEQDKAYSLGYTNEQVPVGTWMVGFRVDNQEVWDMIKQGQVKGISIEGNFEYKFSSFNKDEYLLEEIINILNQINQ
jgi:hypothetical protein